MRAARTFVAAALLTLSVGCVTHPAPAPGPPAEVCTRTRVIVQRDTQGTVVGVRPIGRFPDASWSNREVAAGCVA